MAELNGYRYCILCVRGNAMLMFVAPISALPACVTESGSLWRSILVVDELRPGGTVDVTDTGLTMFRAKPAGTCVTEMGMNSFMRPWPPAHETFSLIALTFRPTCFGRKLARNYGFRLIFGLPERTNHGAQSVLPRAYSELRFAAPQKS